MSLEDHPIVVVVGSGGVGKTTLAAALGVSLARRGRNTLVMTFDPSMRLKDALGVGDAALDSEAAVDADTPGRLAASLLDARRTFDRLVERYAPDEASRRRILHNRFYHHLAGHLSGILEYMAVERLYEVAGAGRYDRIVLDTPPTRQALDFLQAPQRIVSFLDSGALRIALRPWFDEDGHLKITRPLWGLGARVERFLDRVVGLELLRDMAEFFQSFEPLYEGFRRRAELVQGMLQSERTLFLLATGPAEEGHPDTLFLARRLRESGYRLGPVVVNRVHPRGPREEAPPESGNGAEALQLLLWLARRDQRGLDSLRDLLPGHPVLPVPLLASEPSTLADLEPIGERLLASDTALAAAQKTDQSDPETVSPLSH